MKIPCHDIEPYITGDGPEIRELPHPGVHTTAGVARQSLAKARVAPGSSTLVHRHAESGEIYHIVSRRGRMEPGEREFPASDSNSDSVCIVPLMLLCACTAPCSHEDSELLEA